MRTTQICAFLITLVFLIVLQAKKSDAQSNHPNSFLVKGRYSVSKRVRTIPFCKLLESGIGYNDTTIRTTAVLYSPSKGVGRVDGDSDEVFYEARCNNSDYFVKADFSKTRNLSRLERISTRKDRTNSPSLFLLTFTGRFTSTFMASYGHLGWLRAQFSVYDIEFVKIPGSTFPLPDFKSVGPILQTSLSLQLANSTLMTSFVANSLPEGFNDVLSDAARIVFNGKKITKNTFLRLSQKQKRGVVEYRVAEVHKSGNAWRFRGTIATIFEDKTKKVFDYENKYLARRDGSWGLVYTSIRESKLSIAAE